MKSQVARPAEGGSELAAVDDQIHAGVAAAADRRLERRNVSVRVAEKTDSHDWFLARGGGRADFAYDVGSANSIARARKSSSIVAASSSFPGMRWP